MPSTRIFNAKTQKVELAELSVDPNNEIVATFADKSIVKFPAGLSKDEFKDLVDAHQKANEGQEIITPESEAEAAKQRAASLALIGEEPESDKTDDADSREASN